jgi:hypothetical protein
MCRTEDIDMTDRCAIFSSRKSFDSLILSVDQFNRLWDQGQTDAVLMPG